MKEEYKSINTLYGIENIVCVKKMAAQMSLSDTPLYKSYEAAYRNTAGIQVMYNYISQHSTVKDKYLEEDLVLAITSFALCLNQEETKVDDKGNVIKLDLSHLSSRTGISAKSLMDIVMFVQKDLLPKIYIPPMTIQPFSKFSVVVGGLAFVNSERVHQMMTWYQSKGGNMEDVLDMLCYYQRIGLGTKQMSSVNLGVYKSIVSKMPGLEVVEGCASPLDYTFPNYCSPRPLDIEQFGSRGSIFPYLKKLNKPVLLLLNPPRCDNFLRVLIRDVGIYLQKFFKDGAAVVYILPKANQDLEKYVNLKMMNVYRINDGRMIYTTTNVPDISEFFTKVIPKLNIRTYESSECSTLNIYSHIDSNKHIYIPYDSLSTCDNLQLLLTGAIKTDKIEYPYVSTFLSSQHIKHLASNTTSSRVVPVDITEKWQYDVPDVNIGFGGTKYVITYSDDDYERLNIITDYFTGKARAQGQLFTNKSPIVAWKIKSAQVAQQAVLYSKKHKAPLDMKALSEALFLAKIPMCTNFKIAVAIVINRLFNTIMTRPGSLDTLTETGNLVCFDPFGGWGDRAIGASLSGVVSKYICTDSNENLREGYANIKNFFEELRPNCQIEQHITPIEDFDLDSIPGEVDLVFSGPPYFDVETYSPCKGQSNIDHPEFQDWMTWFLKQTLRVVNKIRSDGYLVYYLANHENNITRPLIDTLYQSKRVDFVGTLPIIRDDYERRPILLYVWRKL